MKKGLINEAFRLQQLAGLAPINEVFEEAMDTKFKEGDIVFVKVNGTLEDKPRQIFGAYGSDYSVSGHEKKPDGSYSTDGGISVDADDIQLAGDINEEGSLGSGATDFNQSPAFAKLAKGLGIFMDMKKDGTITEEQYMPIIKAIINLHDELAEAYSSSTIHEELGENDMPQKKSLDTKNICNIEFDDVDESDYPDFADAYIYAADWCDTGEPLSEDELDQLNDDVDFVHEALFDYLY